MQGVSIVENSFRALLPIPFPLRAVQSSEGSLCPLFTGSFVSLQILEQSRRRFEPTLQTPAHMFLLFPGSPRMTHKKSAGGTFRNSVAFPKALIRKEQQCSRQFRVTLVGRRLSVLKMVIVCRMAALPTGFTNCAFATYPDLGWDVLYPNLRKQYIIILQIK